MSDGVGVACRESRVGAFLNLRGDAADPGFRNVAASVTGVELPVEPCTWRRHAGHAAAYWLGPDEWLLAMQNGVGVDLESRLRDVLDPRCSVVDVSGAHVQVELSGEDAGKVLQKSSPYDFDPRNFGVGRCVQTVFAKATALVAAREADAFDIVFRRSYADYLLRWLEDAAAEYNASDGRSP
ncbi:MAG: sarcosine oxidase, gamma subunit family protein [Gammaproteobacteria bacterium]|nr:sarcosine oxidase, gamma subunit family protein [Gammaproteobacteria bacterium]